MFALFGNFGFAYKMFCNDDNVIFGYVLGLCSIFKRRFKFQESIYNLSFKCKMEALMRSFSKFESDV